MKRLCIIVGLIFAILPVRADTKSALDSAKNLYTKGDFYEAQIIYQQLVDSNYSSNELYYNLANCYFRGDQFAPAIYYYEKALQINPNDENTIANLKIANSRIADKINVLKPVFYVRAYNDVTQWFSSDVWAVICIVFLFLTVSSAILYLLARKRSIKKIGFLIGFIFLVTTAASLHFSIKQRKFNQDSPYAVVFEDVMIKSSPSSDGNNLFEIHQGLKVMVTDTLNNWAEIKLPDGKQGWANSATLKML